jgi:hypothetical protein
VSRRDVEKSLFSDKHRLGVNAPVYASSSSVVSAPELLFNFTTRTASYFYTTHQTK